MLGVGLTRAASNVPLAEIPEILSSANLIHWYRFGDYSISSISSADHVSTWNDSVGGNNAVCILSLIHI